MKTAINQWAFPADMPTLEALSRARQAGFEAFEPCVDENGCIGLDASDADLAAIRRDAESKGIELSSLACGLGWKYPLSSPDKKTRERGKEVVAKALRVAQRLGVDALLVVPGVVTPEVPYDVALENALLALRDLVAEAEKAKVALALENVWNKFLLSPLEMRDFIDQFDSEFLGAYVDTGNVVAYGYPEQWLRILGRRVRGVHVKDFRASTGTLDGFVMLMEGDVNWPAVMEALREIDYRGALVAEFGPYKHSRDVMLQHVLTSLSAIRTM